MGISQSIICKFLKIFEEVYDWRGVRLQRLVEQFAKHSEVFFDEDPYGDRYVEMSDYAEYFKEQYGIEFTDEQMAEMRTVEKEGIEAEPRQMRVRNADGEWELVNEMTYIEWLEWKANVG